MIPKAQAIKEKIDYIKMKTMSTSKDTIKKTKGQIHKMEEITDKSYIADKGLVSKTYKYSYSSKI